MGKYKHDPKFIYLYYKKSLMNIFFKKLLLYQF
jgi:hypothetical protein